MTAVHVGISLIGMVLDDGYMQNYLRIEPKQGNF